MRIKKIVVSWVLMLFAGAVFAASSPIPMLQGAADKIISVLQQNKGQLESHPDVIYQAVRRHLLPLVDVSGMSRSVLGRKAWASATPAERQQFAKLFTNLVIRTYSKPLAAYSNETVKFVPLRQAPTGRFVRVNSIIVRPSAKDIPLAYSLVNKNGQWKVYDLSVEGVSLLQSFRSQFAQELRRGSMADLLKEMQQSDKAS